MIRLQRAHRLAPPQARSAVQAAADELAREYALTSGWDGDTLHFERAGVRGWIRIAPERI